MTSIAAGSRFVKFHMLIYHLILKPVKDHIFLNSKPLFKWALYVTTWSGEAYTYIEYFVLDDHFHVGEKEIYNTFWFADM
jgi:hypothetical protein